MRGTLLCRRAVGVGAVRRLSSSTPARAEALQALMRAQGHAACDPGAIHQLHPLVVPLATSASGEVLGLLRWPAKDGATSVVRARRQGSGLSAAAVASGLFKYP